MYNFKIGEVYRCVSSTNEDRFIVGNLYPVIDVVLQSHDGYISSENGVNYTDAYFNEYMKNGNSNLAKYEFELVKPKPDPKPVTIDVATLLELLVIKKYTATELVIYLKGYEKGIEQ